MTEKRASASGSQSDRLGAGDPGRREELGGGRTAAEATCVGVAVDSGPAPAGVDESVTPAASAVVEAERVWV